MNTTVKTVNHFDVVGSFLRPEYLKDARKQFEDGEIEESHLIEVENKAIIDLIKKQEAAGLNSITDGEFRRSWWHLDFFWHLNNVERSLDVPGYSFSGEVTRGETARITGKISGINHAFVDHYKFIKAHISDEVEARQTIPAPSQFYNETFLFHEKNIEAAKSFYDSKEELIQDIVDAYKTVINDLYDAGLRTLQLDDCSWDILFTDDENKFSEEEQSKRHSLKTALVDINNAVIEDLPEDLFVQTHICRGNYASHHFASGGYETVSHPLFEEEKVNRFYLEYDDERAGGFEPLTAIPDSTQVVLGLITTKNGELEDANVLKERVVDASKYHPLENLLISPQCGFSSTEEGNKLSEEEQWAKIALAKSVSEDIWQV